MNQITVLGILAEIESSTGRSLSMPKISPVSGGCIHRSQLWECGSFQAFVKSNQSNVLSVFEAEFAALMELKVSDRLRVPSPITCGLSEDSAFLVIEFIPLQRHGDAFAMGQGLADLHRRVSSNHCFGWHRDNVIGETPQPNPWTRSWPEFFANHRLRHQFHLASQKGRTFPGADHLLDAVPDILSHEPAPSLLHGDLWSGNAAFDESGRPVVFDPAIYYGDREADIAFTYLFGGFSKDFYEAYEDSWPLPAGHLIRRRLYNLYHELNHFWLFGGGYGNLADQSIQWLLQNALKIC